MAARQLKALGVSADEIKLRVSGKRLHRKGYGVYSVGTPNLTRDGRRWVALLAAGTDAVLSHREAGAIHGIRHWSGVIEVTLPRKRRRRRGLLPHRAKLRPDEITTVRGMRVTTVARTLLDLASLLSADDMESALRQSEFNGPAPGASLPQLMDRYPHRSGVPMLRCLFAAGTLGDGVSKSEMEKLFGRRARGLDLPRAKRNWNIRVRDGSLIEGDFVWPDQRVNVELDSWRSHGRRSEFEADRRRDLRLKAAGWEVIRITWKQLTEDWDSVAADLLAAFDQRSSSEAGTAPSRSTDHVPSAS